MRDLPDSELMALYARGSERAFAELFRRYEGRAYGYFLRRTRSDARARDLYQDLFLRLHRFRDSYDPARPFDSWFFQIAHSVLVDEWRRLGRRAEVAADATLLRSPDPDAERVVSARERAGLALRSLSPEQARIVWEAKALGRDHGEIAAALEKSVDAVKQAASRSVRQLRRAPALGD